MTVNGDELRTGDDVIRFALGDKHRSFFCRRDRGNAASDRRGNSYNFERRRGKQTRIEKGATVRRRSSKEAGRSGLIDLSPDRGVIAGKSHRTSGSSAPPAQNLS
jgi:hypothetical protein